VPRSQTLSRCKCLHIHFLTDALCDGHGRVTRVGKTLASVVGQCPIKAGVSMGRGNTSPEPICRSLTSEPAMAIINVSRIQPFHTVCSVELFRREVE
jgi:hypothetical protein